LCRATESALGRIKRKMTGTLKINNGESRVDGTLLGREVESGQDPLGAATDFVKNSGCNDGNCVTVTGTFKGKILYIDSATKVTDAPCAPAQTEALAFATSSALAQRIPAKKKSAKKVAPGKKSAKKVAPVKRSVSRKALSKAKPTAKKASSRAGAPSKKSLARKAVSKKGKRR
jgi:hypothetical protein